MGSAVQGVRAFLQGWLAMAVRERSPLYQPTVEQPHKEDGEIENYFLVKTFSGHILKVTVELFEETDG